MTNTFSAMSRRGLAMGALALAMMAAGCGKQEPTATAAGSGPIALNIGTMKIAALSNLYAAEKLGYFKEQGLAVTFTEMGGGAELLPAVSAGKIDITLSIPAAAIQADDKGFDFAMVLQNEVAASKGQDSQAVFVNANSGIDKLADLKGKTTAINNLKNQMWLSFIAAVKKDGVQQQDVNFIELPLSNMQDALINKQVDAVFNVEPFTSRMLADKRLKVISYPATEALPAQPIGAFWASRKWLQTHDDAARKFVAAMHKSTDYLQQHPEEAQQMIADYTGIKLEAIKQMRPVIWSSKVDKDTVQSLIGMMKDNGLIASDIKVDTVVYPTALN
jgi:NitT/TauT family transport system substrate-binding protein